jgi:hypothetical protein
MNVEIGTETPLFLFWEYLFQNFGILSLQFVSKRYTMQALNYLHKGSLGGFICSPLPLFRTGFTGSRVKPVLTLPTSLMKGFEHALLSKVFLVHFLSVILFNCVFSSFLLLSFSPSFFKSVFPSYHSAPISFSFCPILNYPLLLPC